MRARGPLLCALLLVASCKPTPVTVQNGSVTAPAAAARDRVALGGRVTDAAHVLTAQEIEALTHHLADFEAQTRHQMVIVTVPSLEGKDVASYARALGNRWGIGRKGYNDGIVVLLAPKEREVRIAVGYGLEKTLPNDYLARVIKLMTPCFVDRHFYDGLMAGVTILAHTAR